MLKSKHFSLRAWCFFGRGAQNVPLVKWQGHIFWPGALWLGAHNKGFFPTILTGGHIFDRGQWPGYTFAPEHPCWFGALFTFKTLFLSSSREIKLFWERWSQNDLSWQLMSKFQKRSKWPNLFIWNFVRNSENFGWVMLILPLLLQRTMLLAEKCRVAAETICVNKQNLFRNCSFASHFPHVLN